MNETLHRVWPAALTTVIALLYAWIGLAAQGRDQILGITGGLVILVALIAARSRAAATVLLVAGALPLAVATWWSIVTPVLAILALALGWFAIRNLGHRWDRPARVTTSKAAA